MTTVRRGLGRGLGALIPTAAPEKPREEAPTPSDVSRETSAPSTPQVPENPDGLASVEGAAFAELPVGTITPNPRQPRQVFDEDALNELVHSLKEIGLLQPIVVRRLGPEKYELVMGERRWRAAQLAELETIPAIIRETTDDAMLRDALLENLHRAQLNPLEEAAAYGQLLEDFGCTHEELGSRIGRSRPQITNTLRLLKLPPSVQRRVAAGVLSAGHARALLALDDEERQEQLAHRVVAEGISVRALEEIIAIDGGQKAKKAKAAKQPKPYSPKLADLEGRLGDRFETRVKVDLGRSKGKITVEFGSLDDLQRIVDLMDPSKRTS
jgi:ParB family transcriptional regulator, chromosome partitioning protein